MPRTKSSEWKKPTIRPSKWGIACFLYYSWFSLKLMQSEISIWGLWYQDLASVYNFARSLDRLKIRPKLTRSCVFHLLPSIAVCRSWPADIWIWPCRDFIFKGTLLTHKPNWKFIVLLNMMLVRHLGHFIFHKMTWHAAFVANSHFVLTH